MGFLVRVRLFIPKPHPCDRCTRLLEVPAPTFVLAGQSPSPVHNYRVVFHARSPPCFVLFSSRRRCSLACICDVWENTKRNPHDEKYNVKTDVHNMKCRAFFLPLYDTAYYGVLHYSHPSWADRNQSIAYVVFMVRLCSKILNKNVFFFFSVMKDLLLGR